MANDSMKKELVAHKVYSAWQFITYTEKILTPYSIAQIQFIISLVK